jgi:uncharacterized protein YbjT (DUF2867 family)
MKIVIIGGSGLIGSKTADRLRKKGHDVVAASPSTGVNTVTGEGLAAALAGAQVVVDLANSPTFEEKAALAFFEASGHNLLGTEAAAGVRHHVALSVVGTDRLQTMGYFRGKMLQENLIAKAGIPYTIVRSTQFFEFMGAIAQSGGDGQTLQLSSSDLQPIASDNVADAVANAALAEPVNGIIEIAGPERAPLSEFVARFLKATNDPRTIVANKNTPYFGVDIDDRTLVPGDGPHLGAMRFDDWLSRSAGHK